MPDAAAPTDYPSFRLTIEANIAHLALSQPDAFNAMTPDFWHDLPEIIRDIDRHARARCIVISSTGKHFSSGMDLSVFQNDPALLGAAGGDPYLQADAFTHNLKLLQQSLSCLEEARMPVIAAIQGGCIGGAVDLVAACDFRLATQDAFFCIQEINIGMVADVGAFPRLCRIMPEGWVRQIAYTGERLPAEKAAQLGLVNSVYDTQEAMLAAAMEIAASIAAKDPLAITGSKQMMNYARDHSTADTLAHVALMNAAMLPAAHMQKAMLAMAQKRAPEYANLLPLREKPLTPLTPLTPLAEDDPLSSAPAPSGPSPDAPSKAR